MMRPPALLFALAGLAAPASALEPQEILACMARNEPQRSIVQTIVLRSLDRLGTQSTSKATLYWRKQPGDRSDLLMRFFEPPDMSGAALLIEEHGPGEPPTMFLYVPELGRARRVSAGLSSGPVFGTNFSVEDFELLYGIVRYGEIKAGDEDEVAGRRVHTVEARPLAASGSEDRRVVISVDAETCVALRVDFFEAGDRLRKRLEIDPEKVHSEGGLRVPGFVAVSDLRAETSSELIVEELEVDAEIPGPTFEPAWRTELE